MKKDRRKLKLHRETLRYLNRGDLPGVVGAAILPSDPQVCTYPSCIDGCLSTPRPCGESLMVEQCQSYLCDTQPEFCTQTIP